MGKNVISVEHLSKQYDLGVVGSGTLTRDVERWWARVRKQPDPYTIIGREDAFKHIGESILALDDVSFTVQQGEALGIIGKNGAGKSTLLKILSRVTAPTSGVVKVKGRIGSLLEVGTGFHPELTGRENVFLNGAILGMRREEVARKFDEIVAFAGVEKFIDTPVKRYSSGMYVRLGFAVAAHLDPEILIVDEVLAVGDAEFQKKCLGKMGEVAVEGRTVIFVSHNMKSIEALCQNGILISEGKAKFQGEINSCINKYLQIDKTSVNKIIGNLEPKSDVININKILINKQELDKLTLKSNQNTLIIEFFGNLKYAIPLDLEVRVKDIYGSCLGFFSPGHMRGYANILEKGNFHLVWKLNLPAQMTRGEYFLDLSLTNPDKKVWTNITDGLKIIYEGFPTSTGRLIEYGHGAGWIIL